MIAILYESDETEFTSNGLGGIPDCYEDNIHWKFNGEYELSFKYKVSGHNYDKITEDRIVFVAPAPNKDKQPFRINRIVTSTDKNSITVYAKHLCYDLSFVPLKPFTAGNASEAVNGLKANSLIAHNFTFYTDITTEGTFTVSEPTSVRNWLGGREGSILDVFGGAYDWDRWNVKLLKNLGTDKGITIRYGKNLKTLEQDKKIDSVYTGTIAYWIDSNTKKIVMSDIQYIENHLSYSHEKIFPFNASQEYQSEPTIAQLNTRAVTYNTANDIGKPSVGMNIDFESLSQTDEYKDIATLETVNAGDTIHVIYERFNVSSSGRVNEYNYSWTKEKYKDITIGDLKSSLNQAVANTIQKNVIPQTASFLEASRKRATDLLTGAFGGHMVIGYNADGEPEETYWMDTGDTATATKVLRANYNGIGGSVNGINGPYGVSMTLDGHMNADYIDTGTLRAINIEGVNISGSTIKTSSLIFANGLTAYPTTYTSGNQGVLFKGGDNSDFSTETTSAGINTLTGDLQLTSRSGNINIDGGFTVDASGVISTPKDYIQINTSADSINIHSSNSMYFYSANSMVINSQILYIGKLKTLSLVNPGDLTTSAYNVAWKTVSTPTGTITALCTI